MGNPEIVFFGVGDLEYIALVLEVKESKEVAKIIARNYSPHIL